MPTNETKTLIVGMDGYEYMRRFENELPLWLQLAMRSARKQRV